MKRLGILLLATAAACAGHGGFNLSAEDNNEAALAKAMSVERKPTPGKPMNAVGTPMALVVASGTPKKLIAWDLGAGKQAWQVDADVASRVVVGGHFVAALEGKTSIVARDLADGHKLWSMELPAKTTFLGATADDDHVYFTVQDDSGDKRTWAVIALGPTGTELWRQPAPGTLGSPAARGGLVYVPFLTQWLTILDAKTGLVLTRIRTTDEAINYVRATSDGVFYGSRGVFALDDRSVSGNKTDSDYGAAILPDFAEKLYSFDAFNAVQAGYSAYDRSRLLWRASVASNKLEFADDQVVAMTYRYFFAFGTDGKLKWAHQHPRYDVVSAEHTGKSIVYVSTEGELVVLDPATGALLSTTSIPGVSHVLGATFDADGWRPSGEVSPAKTSEVLASIVGDRDARFTAVKVFATGALGTLPGADVTQALLKILLEDATPKDVYAKTAQTLIDRKDATSLPMLIEALGAQKDDFIAGTKARAVDVIARAIAGIGKPDADAALVAHLQDPDATPDDVAALATALGAGGGRDAIGPLVAYLVMNRADPYYRQETTSQAMKAVVDAVLELGGAGERSLVAWVAADARTDGNLAEYAKSALAKTASR